MRDGLTIETMDDLMEDLAGTHPSTAGKHPQVDPDLTAADKAALLERGYLIVPDLVPPETLDRIRAETAPLLGPTGRNSFEGGRTQRVYAVLAKTDCANSFLEHPRLLCLVDELLLPNYLLSMFQVIKIHPGERQQVLHHDDGFFPIPRPRPRPAFSVATILAVDDFTEENGATVVIPGSHRWDDRRPGPEDQAVPAVMSAGSVLVLLGTTWHGGGANSSDGPRLAVTAQYGEPWARTQENMSLAVPREVARRSSPTIQSLLGYSIHPPFVGQVNGMSPLRCLGTPEED